LSGRSVAAFAEFVRRTLIPVSRIASRKAALADCTLLADRLRGDFLE
jgi:hypothetical protein